MIETEPLCVKQTVKWVREFVIKLNLCPFAKREMDKGSVRVQASQALTVDDAMIDLMTEIELLGLDSDIETTLLVFPSYLTVFLITLILLIMLNQYYEPMGKRASIN